MKAKACVKPSPTRKRKRRYDKTCYKYRNVIERFFRKIKAVPTRRDPLREKAANFASFVYLAAGLAGLI
ncbi:MAG: hypothetical protein AAGC44_14730 [Planctomycetota bacterium]